MNSDTDPHGGTRSSIEQRLRWLIISGVGTVLLTASLILQYVVEKRLVGEYDRALTAKARALATLTKQFGTEVEFDFADEFMPEFEAPWNPEYFQLWYENGSVLERSRSLKSGNLPRSGRTEPGQWISNLALPDGREGRAVEIVFHAQIEDKEGRAPHTLPPQQKIILVVARERESLMRTLLLVRLSLAASIAVMIIIVAWVVRSAVRRGLRPLHEVGAQLRRLDAGRLNSRLAFAAPPRELIPLIEQFNDLLDRLQKSFQREQRFSSDVAHELRTPVAELRSLAEIATRWPEDSRLVENFFRDVFDISLEMQRIITHLLELTRCEDGETRPEFQKANLPALIDESWLRVERKAREKRLVFTKSNLECHCLTGIRQLELILSNLFSNAVAYSAPGTEIRVLMKRLDGDWSLTISNIAQDLTPGDLDVMFDRLWRKDPSRTAEGHAGLGLSLVEAHARMLGLTLNVDLDETGRFSITLCGLRDAGAGSAPAIDG